MNVCIAPSFRNMSSVVWEARLCGASSASARLSGPMCTHVRFSTYTNFRVYSSLTTACRCALSAHTNTKPTGHSRSNGTAASAAT